MYLSKSTCIAGLPRHDQRRVAVLVITTPASDSGPFYLSTISNTRHIVSLLETVRDGVAQA